LEIGYIQTEIENAPEEKAEELALIDEARGIPSQSARNLASQIMENKETALDTLAREELGIDPSHTYSDPQRWLVSPWCILFQ